jgi:hypothetical protein
MRTPSKIAFAALLLAACGDDTPGKNGNPAPPPPPPPPPPAKLKNGAHIEDFVTDHEKGSIRHQFKERDFATEQNRDPFQSFVIAPQQIGPLQEKSKDPGPRLCKDDKIEAAGYSVNDLKLVGIVAQGIAHTALVEAGNSGYILRPGMCVGREKALVKEINDDFMTLYGQPDPNDPNRPQEKFEKTLHPKQLAMSTPEVGFSQDQQRGKSTVAPPTVAPPTVAPPPQPTTTTTTTTKVQVMPMKQTVAPAPTPTAPATISP